MFPRTKAAWARLKAAWSDYLSVRRETVTVRAYGDMSEQQREAFDEAFRHMDRAFEAFRRIN